MVNPLLELKSISTSEILIKKQKLQYFNNYDSTNTKPFRENCKSYFSNKHSKANTDFILSKNGDLIFKNDKIANTFNDYFGSIVENMSLYRWEDKPFSISKDSDIIKNITQKYKNHPSIRSLKRNCKGISCFSFRLISVDEIIKVVKSLSDSKAVGGDIPTKILKECKFPFDIITACINIAIKTVNFPDSLKTVNVTPVFKKEDPLDKSNYRPVSILPLLSKIYEKVIYNQLSDYSNNFLNEVLCDFRKAHCTQHALFKLLQSWQKSLDCGSFVETLLMDLSKAYDFIPHEL